jgi:hypothetical protein
MLSVSTRDIMRHEIQCAIEDASDDAPDPHIADEIAIGIAFIDYLNIADAEEAEIRK